MVNANVAAAIFRQNPSPLPQSPNATCQATTQKWLQNVCLCLGVADLLGWGASGGRGSCRCHLGKHTKDEALKISNYCKGLSLGVPTSSHTQKTREVNWELVAKKAKNIVVSVSESANACLSVYVVLCKINQFILQHLKHHVVGFLFYIYRNS